ncbi:MAG: hypothetical protein QM209_06605 [Candidatus Cloacimonadota bacterium]|jgi:hypothetical protein|nr:hypothetical protein [Candidatus Cloacimonas sp.]MDI9572834.1 hypothetical protein [Candidatus Cloacimonadota bacterium]MDY0218921.1 hypothetical protein [Candidatus Cloacimonas acidaminovorans]HOE55854.1 hypothetical protein [Candidatus Cloacimonas acidaminovorans]HOM79403.1 hypothetical protein [Candidatus Cloacimonas acidaminovorans]
MPKHIILTLALTLGIGLLCAFQTVKYAGFCFSGSYADISKNYPYTQIILQESDSPQSYLDKLFYDYFSANPELGNFTLDIEHKTKATLSLAMALNREEVAFEYYEKQTKAIYNLGCTVFIMDFADLTVLQSYPINVTYIDLYNGEPDQQTIVQTLKKLYSEFILKKLESNRKNIYIRSSGSLTIKVANVNFQEEALPYLGSYGTEQNLETYSSIVAQHLTEALAFKMNLTVLPYSHSNLSYKMSLSFSDASIQNFTIPPSSYDIDVNVLRFVKKLYKETAVERVDLYGVELEMRIYDAEFNTEYWKQIIQNGAPKQTVVGQKIGNEFYNYNEILLLTLSDKIPATLKEDKKLMKGILKKCANY